METVFETIDQVETFVSQMCNAYAMVLDQHLISSDCAHEMLYLRQLHKDYASVEYPYTYWIAIRTRGVEGSEYKSTCIEKVRMLNDKVLCAIKIEMLEDSFKVSFKKIQLNF